MADPEQMRRFFSWIVKTITIGDLIKIFAPVFAICLLLLSPLRDPFLRLFYEEQFEVEFINSGVLDPDREFWPEVIITRSSLLDISPSIVSWEVVPADGSRLIGPSPVPISIEQVSGIARATWREAGRVDISGSYGSISVTASVETQHGTREQATTTFEFRRAIDREVVHRANYTGKWIVQDLANGRNGWLEIDHSRSTGQFSGFISLPGSVLGEAEAPVHGQIDGAIFLLRAVSQTGVEIRFSDYDVEIFEGEKIIKIQGSFDCDGCGLDRANTDEPRIVIFTHYFE